MDVVLGESPARMLARAGIEATPLRLAVVGAMAGAGRALPAGDILALVRRLRPANRVTLYRILDLLVEKGLVRRHSAGDRAQRYCLEPGTAAAPHGHAYCVRCGAMQCLPQGAGLADLAALGQGLAMDVLSVEVRIDGVCAACQALADRPASAAVDGDPGNS
ncbi:MAG: Fe2+/Zn2+ uptake regulation protein [Solidesulfovibrio magneticus str. Maddingley MBC34]|uniref:Fe2+/Zn2+ uptake regulation protein n=1 Tax=Solidesulfovibrio magneticus str. Maddingley MBC34 TaxID=1206767 RepID=K6GC48_9BACT|nr:MAG: Fe2+/Zn2+ uptake regulation protein [Solidesulfovibrio magneticus str. Maddingley MBC34]